MINRKIEYFITLAEVLSFTQAAAIHNVSQTAISQYIANLEDRLDVKLFKRSPHAVVLTEAGTYYYKQVKAILKMYDDTQDHMKNIAASYHGAIKVGIGIYEYCNTEMFFSRFLKLHPEIKVEIFQYPYSELSEKLRTGELDLIIGLAMCKAAFAKSEVMTRKIFESRNLLLADRQLAEKYGDTDAGTILRNEALITNCEDDGPSSLMMLHNMLSDEFGFMPDRIEQTNSLNAQLMMVRASHGVALVPEFVADRQGTDLVKYPLPQGENIEYVLMKLKKNENYAADLMFNFE